jgi:hypothetical protein
MVEQQSNLEKCIGESAQCLGDCRFCKHYYFDRDVEIEYFECKKGHFNFVDHGGFGENEGEMNWFGCKGKYFEFNPNSRWLDGWRKKLEKEANVRAFFPEEFNDSCRERLWAAFLDLITWRVMPAPEPCLSGVEAIAAFSFGFGPKKIEGGGSQYDPVYYLPGKSNEAIADLIQKLLVSHSKIKLEDVFAQQEIADSLSDKYGLEVDRSHIAIPGKEYLGTRGVADMFFSSGLGKYSKIAVFAHPLHVYRCEKTLVKSAEDHGFQPTILIPDTSSVPFDKDSMQPWTRNLELWIPHEINSRAYARERKDM